MAGCSGLGFTVFYGAKRALSPPEITRAKVVCAGCPVQRLCLEDGLDEDWGIWGGYTPPERRRALSGLSGSRQAVLLAFDRGLMDELVSLEGPRSDGPN